MIRRENRASIEFRTVGLITRTPVVWVSLPAGRTVVSRRLGGDAHIDQLSMPILVWEARETRSGRDYWLYDGELWSADVLLDPPDIRALILEQRLKEQARLARAAAAAERGTSEARPRRAPIPAEIRSAVWQRDGGQCVECGATQDLEFDHVIPVSMGGADTLRNLQLLCVSCNAAKGGDLA